MVPSSGDDQLGKGRVLRLLAIGDIVGQPGREIVKKAVPALRFFENISFVVANGENAAGGSGLTRPCYDELLAAGVDCITMGDHVYRRKAILSFIDQADRLVRPANYPQSAPGRAYTIVEAADRTPVAVTCVVGRIFMGPANCPFEALEGILAALPEQVRCIIVDVHAEATSEKQLVARCFDGRVSVVVGTHTHVPTADEQILPGGTAFQCDLGMTGPHESIIGRRIDEVLTTVRTFRPTSFTVASGDVRLNGSIVDVDPSTGRAISIRRLQVTWAQAEKLHANYLAAQEYRPH
ncbi:MAG: YmdB family metallophosphoesterase [Thermoguttaceae bacterium]|nr:YmdB family metallophosphoesterase [Thermoguttaceae bacterium]MDW8078598.1 TIGR00282 family metallophosphoesterase [Thermoguttaceae bacterium]